MLVTLAFACMAGALPAQTPVYLDDTQPIEARVKDALSRMTLEEKWLYVMRRASSAVQVYPVWVFPKYG